MQRLLEPSFVLVDSHGPGQGLESDRAVWCEGWGRASWRPRGDSGWGRVLGDPTGALNRLQAPAPSAPEPPILPLAVAAADTTHPRVHDVGVLRAEAVAEPETQFVSEVGLALTTSQQNVIGVDSLGGQVKLIFDA